MGTMTHPMQKPRALKPGDRISVVSSASPCVREDLDRGMAEIRRLGFTPICEASALDRTGFTAGSPTVRAAAFRTAWCDPSISALIAARGGHGSVHLLETLATWDLTERPKLFIGYSDNTSLLAWLTTRQHIMALHGPMLEGRLARGVDGYDEASFLALVQGRGAGLELRPEGLETLSPGDATGPMHGGTMTQLCASLGTPFAFDPPPGSVLFLEDVNERPYKLDRLLTQLRLSGILSRAVALVFGEMPGCDEPGGEYTARETIRTATADFAGPVLFGFPSGHTTGPCWSLPLGVAVRVRGGGRPSLVVEESPVE